MSHRTVIETGRPGNIITSFQIPGGQLEGLRI
jgi:hypothetical protein